MAVTEDRLLPSTLMHLETVVPSAQLLPLKAKQPELLKSPPKPSGCPHSRPVRPPGAGAWDWMECPLRGLTEPGRNRRI